MESCAQKKAYKAKDYKSDLKPIWCPGCGDYTVLNSITRALAELALPPEEVAVVSGIGCSSRIPAYTSVYGFHGVHGRALPVATGLKLARPDLTVLVTGGDGDGFSIGGNHFLHACRRNVDLTYIVMDNQVYGMTKGQASPTTSPDWEGSKLTPEGTGINPFQPLVVGLASGANFIARVSSSATRSTWRRSSSKRSAIRAFRWCRCSAPASPSARNRPNGATSCAPRWWITPTMRPAPRAA
jgi:2-oxoglutarate ferredoxin oxidoreductase subunit beta